MEHKRSISFIIESPSKRKKLGLYNKYYNAYSNDDNNFSNEPLIDDEYININDQSNFDVDPKMKFNGFDNIESWLDKSMENINEESKGKNKTIWEELLENRLKFKGGMIMIINY